MKSEGSGKGSGNLYVQDDILLHDNSKKKKNNMGDEFGKAEI